MWRRAVSHFPAISSPPSSQVMERRETGHRPNPKRSANALSRLAFCWLVPIFAHGKNQDFETKDLYEVLPENLSGPISDSLENYWELELKEAAKQGRKPSLFRALGITFKWTFLQSGVHVFIMHFICQTLMPISMGLLIWHFDKESTSSTKEAYCYATVFIMSRILDQILFSRVMYNMRSIGITARVACTSLVYRKILKLSYSVKQATRGRMINLLSNDVARLEIFFLFLHILWVMPLQTALLTYLIWRSVGVASLAGVILLIALTVPLLGLSGRVMTHLRRKIAMRTDDRLLLLGEIVRGIRVIKMYTWEKPFERFIFIARRYEIDIIRMASYLKSFLFAIMSLAQRVPLYVMIIIYVIQGNSISAYTMFTLIQYFNILHVLVGSLFLRAISITSETVAVVRRIQEFLQLEEQVSTVKFLPSSNEESIISVKGVSVASIENPEINVLHDINLSIRRNSLNAIVGPVGAGKSLLVKLILDELRATKGQICISGDLSYASQEPWLFKGTLKSNILFGEPFDEAKYERVTRVCALLEDFKQLPLGDETVAGESGTSLSGGQCARINLARAVYRNADVYLLDDPLSAVDSRVGRRLLEDCINGLLRDKTRILITHQVQFLKEADEIILMDKGRIEFQGNFTDLQKNDDLLGHLNLSDEKEKECVKNTESSENSISIEANGCIDVAEAEDPKETEKLLNAKEEAIKIKEKEDSVAKKDMLTRKSLYWKYFTACGSCILPFSALVAFVISQLLCSGSDYFVAYWTKHQKTYLYNSNTTQFESANVSEFLDSQTVIYIFISFTVTIVIMSIVKVALSTTVLNKSNERIHNRMATALIGAKIPFFESNDSGRILNRFSKDMGSVDERLLSLLHEAFEYAFVIIGVVVQISIINKWSVIVIFFMVLLFYTSRNIVIKTTRDIMRLEGQTKSPVFYIANSTFAGRLTIRACRAQSMVSKTFDDVQNNHTAAASVCQYSLIAYSTWLDYITLVFTALVTFSFLFFKNERSSGADVGLAITQLLTLTGILSRGIKLTGDIETQMVSVERLFQYTELEQEEDDGVGQKPPNSWPSQGKIRFEDVCLKYYQNDALILKNLNFTIEAGEKVGIVGRTGAGKSSLISALFRLARVEGSIYIDDINTQEIGLKHLRSKISILPQEPILFPVSLRRNLDPLEEHDDANLWSALRDVELHKVFVCLDVMIDQSNLSTGQRQLVCLARAILKMNKIVILDEATANVDANTDAFIQKTIREKFKKCTVLTIAHRLNTIKDMDKILVMDQGRVVEYDRPQVLLQQNDGYFSTMLSQVTRSVAD